MANPTFIEVRYAILKFFEQENIFQFCNGDEKLVDLKVDEPLKSQLISECMKVYVELEMVKKLTVSGADAWVLSKPLYAYEQPISIGYETALAVAEVVNNYCKRVGNTKELVDPSNVKEKDFKNLAFLSNLLMLATEEKKA